MTTFFMRFPGGLAKALTFSYDDGVESDIRFMNILDKYNMKCTFNINSGCYAPEGKVYPEGTVHRRMSKSECLKAYVNNNHEVAIHGYSHPFWNQIPPAMATLDIVEDRKNLEDLFSGIIRGAAYPFGAYDDTVVEILENAGIAYCRTTKATHSFSIPTDWLRLHPTCHHCDKELNSLADKFLEMNPTRASQLFYVWGHTYEFDRDNNWQVIEDFCEKLGHADDIWYCTNIELYDYIRAFNSLDISADMKIVHNPTSVKIWVDWNGSIHMIDAGETVKL